MNGLWLPRGHAGPPGREDLPPQPELPPIKVLHVITKFWAGAGGNTLLTVEGMDGRRFESWVAGCDGGPLWERAERAGVHAVQLKGFKETISPLADLSVLFQLIRLMRRERFTIVHTHSAKGGFLGRIAAWLTRTPVIMHTFHGFSYHDFMSRRRRAAYLLLERLVRPMTDRFLAVAPRVASEAVAMRLARPGSVTVVPSAVELHDVAAASFERSRRELGFSDDDLVVGAVGRLDFQKAPLDFVRMAARVAAERPEVSFVMIGDGSLEGESKAEAERLGVEVRFTGFRPDAARLAAGFDVFVVTSLYEGLGRSLTEALASGRPVVASAVNGVPDLVEPGVTGLLTSPADPAATAECVLWLLDHPDRAREMGAAGRAGVLALFDPRRMCELIDRAYSDLLGLPDRVVAVTSSEPRLIKLPEAETGGERAEDDGSPVPRPTRSPARAAGGSPDGA